MIFLELVPRNYDNLLRLAVSSLKKYPLLTGINIPDIKRIPNRSYDVVTFLLHLDFWLVFYLSVVSTLIAR